MEKFKIERIFNYPVKEVTDFFMECDGTVYDLNELENVTQWKVIKEEERGDKRIATKEWCAHAQIPKALQHLITPRMLTWYEHSEWDKVNRVYRFKIETFYFKKKVKCQGQTAFAAASGNKTSRVFQMMINVDIPVFGPMAEKLIVDLLKKNEAQDFKLGTEAVEKAFSASLAR